MQVFFYLDESGPFDDHENGEYWPESVVAGIMSFHPLTNTALRPVLDGICRFDGHNLRDSDLHARDLRDRLGNRYWAWMKNAIQSLETLGDDVKIVCFRSTERLALGNAETTYLTVLVEGLVQLIPTLQERAGRAPIQVTIIAENRRVMDRATGGHRHPGGRGKHAPATAEWEAKHVKRHDSAVPRAAYIAVEDYATRLRTRLRLEMIRRGMGARLSVVSSLRVEISDPATDKALNFADFIAHQCRFSRRGADAELYADAIEPRLECDIPIILHRGFEAAERFLRERNFSDALLAVVDVIRDSDSAAVREAAEELERRAIRDMVRANPRLVMHEISDFLAYVDQLARQPQEPIVLDGGPFQSPVDGPKNYLDALDGWCRSALKILGVGATDLVSADALATKRQERTLAWRWGLFRCHHERLRLANLDGNHDAATTAEQVCEPLIPPFARSLEHQPAVLNFLSHVSRADIHAGRMDRALHRLDKIIAFHHETEDWWSVELPELLPTVGPDLDPRAILCEPLGRALHLRARARLAIHWPTRGTVATDPELQAAIADLSAARDEFVFASDRFRVCADIALIHARAGDLPEAVTWLATGVDVDPQTVAETAEPAARVTAWRGLIATIAATPDAVGGLTALFWLFARVLESPPSATSAGSVGVENEAAPPTPVLTELRTVGSAVTSDLLTAAKRVATPSRMAAIRFLRAQAAFLAARGETSEAVTALQTALPLCEFDDAAVAFDWALIGVQLDRARWTARRQHDALRDARRILSRVRSWGKTLDPTWLRSVTEIADTVAALDESGSLDGSQLAKLSSQVAEW